MRNHRTLSRISILLLVLCLLALPILAAAPEAPQLKLTIARWPQTEAQLFADYTPEEQTAYNQTIQNEALYRKLEQAVKEQPESIDLTEFSLGADSGTKDALLALYSHAIFQIGASFTMQTGFGSYKGEPYHIIFPLYYEDLQTEACQTAFDRAMDEALSLVKPSMSDVETLLVLHDYLVRNVRYDEPNPHAHSAYGALVEGRAVCQGYSLALDALLDRVDIPSDVAYFPGHVWNLVQLDGKWYHIDVTWDDPAPDIRNAVQHDLFLLSDSQMDQAHGGHPNTKYFREACTDGTTYGGSNWVFRQEGSQICLTEQGIYELRPENRTLYFWSSPGGPAVAATQTAQTQPLAPGTLWLNQQLYFYTMDMDTQFSLCCFDPVTGHAKTLDTRSHTFGKDSQGHYIECLGMDYNFESGQLEYWSTLTPDEPIGTYALPLHSLLQSPIQEAGVLQVPLFCSAADAGQVQLWAAFYEGGQMTDLRLLPVDTAGSQTLTIPTADLASWDQMKTFLVHDTSALPLCPSKGLMQS